MRCFLGVRWSAMVVSPSMGLSRSSSPPSARDEARDTVAEWKASKSPSSSSSSSVELLLKLECEGCDAIRPGRGAGRPTGFLKMTAASLGARVVVAGVVRPAVDVGGRRLELVLAAVRMAGAVTERWAREVRDGFFCSGADAPGPAVGAGLGPEDDRGGLLPNCSSGDGTRSLDVVFEGLGTGSLDVGLGIPELRTGIDDGGSMDTSV